MNTIYKSKSQVRGDTTTEVEKFLLSGGVIQLVKSRKLPKQKMSGKTTRQSSSGTSGFAVGYPSKSL